MGWLRIERVTWAERALWTALVLVSIAPTALQPAPEAVARAYVEALNRGDVDAALELTDEDFVLNPELDSSLSRRPQARQVLEWRAALNERWRILSWRYNSSQREVHAVVEITNDAWMLIDSRPVVEVVLVIRTGYLIVEQARIESKELRRALRPFLEWASADRPAELGRVWRDRGPRWGADPARGLLALLREWRATREVAEDTKSGQG
jgi:hypothetical protein